MRVTFAARCVRQRAEHRMFLNVVNSDKERYECCISPGMACQTRDVTRRKSASVFGKMTLSTWC
jgi:hypothetical protein